MHIIYNIILQVIKDKKQKTNIKLHNINEIYKNWMVVIQLFIINIETKTIWLHNATLLYFLNPSINSLGFFFSF